ncbi:MAG: ATP-binding protein [Chloroflexota bacterium]
MGVRSTELGDRSTVPPEASGLQFVGSGVLAGGGEMGARMRAMDWAATPLGPVERWPQALKTAVRIMLTSRQPMFVWWGDELINLYNDAYQSILGGKHPWALGQPAEAVWREIWDQVGPRARQALYGTEGTYDEALLLIMERYGYQEETYYTFSYSPVPDDSGGVGGIFCANTNDTQRIIGQRQLALLQELAVATTEARTILEACERSARCLETCSRDLPFALVYLIDSDRQRAVLAGATNVEDGHPAAPPELPLDEAAIWPLAEAVHSQAPLLVAELSAALGDLPTGAWDRPPRQAAVFPIAPSGQGGQAGLLVAGLNPYRLFDDDYRGFLSLVAGQIGAAIGNAQAYEEERKRSEALAELDRAKTAFFSNVSHELRTPLTLLLGPIEDGLADHAHPLPPVHRERVDVVHRNAVRLLRLVNTLLDFSRIEAGRIQASYERTDLGAYTTDLAASFRSAVERAGLRLIVDCPSLSGGVSAYVDREMWEKIVLNLVSNAFKATFDGEIAVSLAARDGQIVLTVRDTGTGIAQEELPRLFDRFHRVQGARARTHEGTGIGLALVQELVRLHGGEIAVESVLGQGTTFAVSLPAGSAHLPVERVAAGDGHQPAVLGALPFVDEALSWLPDGELFPAESDTASGDGAWQPDQVVAQDRPVVPARVPDADMPRVLLADDNRDMRQYVSRLLRERFVVAAVGDGDTALAAVRARRPDLILTDVMMPGLDGFGLLRELRADPDLQDVPVILLSARAGEEARIEGLESGADDYLIKPFSARELLARVEAQIRLARLRAEATRREQLARQAAEAAVRVRDEFLSIAAHELRTPIASLTGQAQLLERRLRREGGLDRARADRPIASIIRQSAKLARLISQLMDIARLEAGKLTVETELTDLCALVESAATDAQDRAPQHTVTVNCLPEVSARVDPLRLDQVLSNLLDNAIKYSPAGGDVEVTLARPTPDMVEIGVRDHGIGIPPDRLDRIFERYYQAHVESYASGMGLGLYVSREIVSLHGGELRAEIPSDGGTRFVVTLPVREVRSQESGIRSSSQTDTPRLSP